MDIKEIIKTKGYLENKILNLCKSFEEGTDLEIKNIGITTVGPLMGTDKGIALKRKIVSIELTIEL